MSGTCCGVVTFSYSDWIAAFPEFAASVTEAQAQGYFNQASLYVNNTACSPIVDASSGGVRETILNMITAHIAQLFGALNGQPSAQTVGRVASATQGSVSVSLDMGPQPATAAWWNQTKYGAAAYAALAPYRTFRYRPGPQPYLGVGGPWGVPNARGTYGGWTG